MIRFGHKGDLSKTTRFFENLLKSPVQKALEKYGQAGVNALSAATPKETGVTAGSWYYEIKSQNGSYSIDFCNSHINEGVPIAIILQFGHGTGTGGWVEGRDYINPAIRPIFDNIADEAWREVTKK